MKVNNIQYILTDIEGTTTSVSFVYEVLFPYFRDNIEKLRELKLNPDVFEAFEQVIELAKSEGKYVNQTSDILELLHQWSIEDRKITPLKTLQGILWKEGYLSGEIKGHVYEDVAPALALWKQAGKKMGVFSSGSVAAQKLIFTYSTSGDLSPYFSDYFDTNTGGKRALETYKLISSKLALKAENILFLSDIREELEAADSAGFKTIQLLREGIQQSWGHAILDFSELDFE